MSARDDRNIRLRIALDNARGEAERLRVAADRGVEKLGTEAVDDECSRLVEVAIEVMRDARDAELLVRRLEQMLAFEAGMRI